jgi:octaprenyl-diphosphate synthase
MDDALDYVASEKQFGKSIGHDLEEGKITLPLIHTLRKCTAVERSRIAVIVLQEFLPPEDFQTVFDLVHRYGGIDYTIATARSYIDQAGAHLGIFPASPVKTALFELANYVVTRVK